MNRPKSGVFVWAVFMLLIYPSRLSPTLARASSSADAVRSRMMDILNQVADIVKQNYYDPNLKGLDWKADVEVARDRIRRADHEGEMAAAISGLLARLNDSHTYFLRPWRLQPVIFGFRAKAFGEDVRVYEIMRRGPAEEAGLQIGDRIVAVENFAANRQLIDEEMRYFQYLDPQLTMRLKILREDGTLRDYDIKGKQPATSSKDFVKTWEEYRDGEREQERDVKLVGKGEGIAYFKLSSFMVSTSEANSRLKKAKEAQVLILDLRDNGGGREDTMKDLASHFLPVPVHFASVVSRNKKEEINLKPSNPNLVAPLFVLVDSHSASAAEMVARIFQIKGRATIIGDLTAGKVNRAQAFGGVGGTVYGIPFGVVVTVARAIMPDGKELEGRGVIPDIKCVPSEQDIREGRDSCLEQALVLARQASSKLAQTR
jgi:carboxyl-terminal processing protease